MGQKLNLQFIKSYKKIDKIAMGNKYGVLKKIVSVPFNI